MGLTRSVAPHPPSKDEKAAVLFELAREAPNSQAAAPLYPISIADILRHTRLGDGDRLVDCFTAINHACDAARRTTLSA